MEFFNSAVDVLQTLVIALGAGLGIWGVINLLEGYGNDNPGAKSQGMKQLIAGDPAVLLDQSHNAPGISRRLGNLVQRIFHEIVGLHFLLSFFR